MRQDDGIMEGFPTDPEPKPPVDPRDAYAEPDEEPEPEPEPIPTRLFGATGMNLNRAAADTESIEVDDETGESDQYEEDPEDTAAVQEALKEEEPPAGSGYGSWFKRSGAHVNYRSDEEYDDEA